MAYPTTTFEFRESFARDHFVDALDNSEMRIRIKQSRPRSLNDAVILAVELAAHQRAERKCYARHINVDLSSDKLVELVKALSAKIESLETDLKDLQLQRSQDNARDTFSSSKRRLCYFCRKLGHLRRDCVVRRQSKSKRRKSRAENHICKDDSTNSKNNAGQHDEPKTRDVAQHRLAKDGSIGCHRVATVESMPISTDRKMIKDQVRPEKNITNSTSTTCTVDRTFGSAKGYEKYPKWKLARRRECKKGRRRRGMKGGSPGIRFGRGMKSSSERLRPHGVEADGSRLQASDNMPGEATMQEIPDLRENQMFHKRWKTSSARRKVEVCIYNV